VDEGQEEWNQYQNPTYGFTLQYPPGWFALPNLGAPDTDTYFSNESVGAPMEMSMEGIWLTVRKGQPSAFFTDIFAVSVGDTVQNGTTSAKKTGELTIDNQHAVSYLYYGDPLYSSENMYEPVYVVSNGETIYSFDFFVAGGQEAGEQYSSVFEKIVTSFTFP
jgi:hypothetical protein